MSNPIGNEQYVKQSQLQNFYSNKATSPVLSKHANNCSNGNLKTKANYEINYSQVQHSCKHISSLQEIQKLNKKIKTVKSALKIAEQHNEELHTKLTEQKKSFLAEKQQLQAEANKYRSLYEMVIQNYQIKIKQYKDCKKKLKKYEKQLNQQGSRSTIFDNKRLKSPAKSKGQNENERDISSSYVNKNVRMKEQKQERTPKQMQQLLTEYQVSIQHLKHENKLLKEEIMLKNRKLSQYEIIVQTYQSEQKMNQIATNHKDCREVSDLQYKVKCLENDLQAYIKDKELSNTKIRRLQVELQATKHLKQSIEQEDGRIKRQIEQVRVELMMREKQYYETQNEPQNNKWKFMYEDLNIKYQQMLTFTYEIQKDFQRQLHTMAKQMTRRQIVKGNHRG